MNNFFIISLSKCLHIFAFCLLSQYLVAAELAPAEINQAYYQSYASEQQQNYAQAIRDLSKVFDAYGTTFTVNLRLGYLYNINKQYSNAESHYQKAITALPSAIPPKLGLMTVYQNMGKFEQAASVGYELLKIDFYNYYGNLQLASVLWQQKKYPAVLQIYQKMLALYPSDVTLLAAEGELLYVAGELEDAKNVLYGVLVLDPQNVTANAILAKIK